MILSTLHLIFAFFEVSGGELLVIMMFALIFFGSKKIPEIARGIGKGIREVKDATESVKKEIQKETMGMREELRELQDQSRAMIEDTPINDNKSVAEAPQQPKIPSDNTSERESSSLIVEPPQQQINPELKNPE